MTTWVASAPGKLVMAGEYAVLEGAPALVLALDRRARVRAMRRAGDGLVVAAPDIGVREARACLRDGTWQWQENADVAGRLGLVAAVLARPGLAGRMRGSAWHVALDTAAFFAPNGRGKLGLGSSAALTVALGAALCAAAGGEAPDTAALLAMHRGLQEGRGSGLDIAASGIGGILVYRLDAGRPTWRRVAWPADVHWRVVWSGRPASTAAALARLAAWRVDHARRFDGHMRTLSTLADAVVSALDAGDGGAMLEAMADYAGALARFGIDCGIDIVSDEHRRIASLAAADGLLYKTCGAGGGDVGVVLGRDADALNHFSRQVAAAGFQVLDAGLDPHGLDLRDEATGNRRSSWTTSA